MISPPDALAPSPLWPPDILALGPLAGREAAIEMCRALRAGAVGDKAWLDECARFSSASRSRAFRTRMPVSRRELRGPRVNEINTLVS